VLFTNYDLLFLRIDHGHEKSDELKKYAKRRMIGHCLLSVKKVKNVLRMNAYDLISMKTKEDVNRIVSNS
jgi:hypothetical protein